MSFQSAIGWMILGAGMILEAGCRGDEPGDQNARKAKTSQLTFRDVTSSFEQVVLLSESAIEDEAIDLVFHPDRSGKYFVAYRNGRIEGRAANHAVMATSQIAVRQNNECGLMAMEVDPDFAQNGRLFAGYCVPGAGLSLRAFHWPATGSTIGAGSLIKLFDMPPSFNDFHNLGDLGFDDDGNLWVTYGDGNNSNPQDTLKFNGKLLRIRPHAGDEPGYTIPDDNPYRHAFGIAPEVVAYGFKSPFRANYFEQTWFIGDVGLDGWEEINLVTLGGPNNFGYPLCEGNFKLVDYDAIGTFCDLDASDHYKPPSLVYIHDNFSQPHKDDLDVGPGGAWAISGGLVYRGTGYHGLMNRRYVYADYVEGFVRTALVSDKALFDYAGNAIEPVVAGEKTLTADRPLGHLSFISAWAEGPDGFIYMVAANGLWRLLIEPTKSDPN